MAIIPFDYRPHYHAIVFNLEIPDLKLYRMTDLNDCLYTSEYLNKIWKNGMVWVEEANYETIGYVSRYVTKKLYGAEAKYYEDFNLVPEFYTCSRKPGIGRQYYEDHKEQLFKESKYFFPTRNGVASASPGRYFFNLFEADFDPESVKANKEALKAQFKAREAIKLENTSLDRIDYYKVEEYNKLKQVEKLKRNQL